MLEYICFNCTPYVGFSVGKKYKGYKNSDNFVDNTLSYVVYDDTNRNWLFLDNNDFLGFHKYFKIPIKEERKLKLEKLNKN